MLVFEVIGVNILRMCKRMALTIEFLTPGTCINHARIGTSYSMHGIKSQRMLPDVIKMKRP